MKKEWFIGSRKQSDTDPWLNVVRCAVSLGTPSCLASTSTWCCAAAWIWSPTTILQATATPPASAPRSANPAPLPLPLPWLTWLLLASRVSTVRFRSCCAAYDLRAFPRFLGCLQAALYTNWVFAIPCNVPNAIMVGRTSTAPPHAYPYWFEHGQSHLPSACT